MPFRRASAFLLLLASLSLGAQGTYRAEPWNGMQINYNIGGATVTSSSEGGPFCCWINTLKGTLATSGNLSVSGSVGMGSGYHATARVVVSVGGQSKSWSETVKSGFPNMNWASFNVSVPIPPGAKEGSILIDMTGSYNAGSRGLSVSGTFTLGTAAPAAPLADPDQAHKPLCPEARIRFPLASKGGPTNLMMDHLSLAADFERAIDRFNQEHKNAQVHTTDHVGGTIPALLWLFSEGGTTFPNEVYVPGLGNVSTPGLKSSSEYSAQSFVFLPKGAAEKAQRGNYVAPHGTEPALAEEIRQTALKEHRKLTPGDVLRLALEQRKGNLRDAMLLAHNTLRSLGRQGDAGLTGVATDPSYFGKYLSTLREGGDNAGPWYHFFGTAYFGLQARGDYAMMPFTIVPDMASAKTLELWRKLGLGLKDPKQLRQGSDTLSMAANEAEQLYRQFLGGRTSDPEKYCFNLWGAQIATWLYRTKVPKAGIDTSALKKPFADFLSAASTQACNQMTAFMNKVKADLAPPPATKRKPFGLRGYFQGSPVSSVWESQGQRLVLDQKTSDLRGFVPALVTPFRDTHTGTWGMLGFAPASDPMNIRMEAVADGPVHLVIFDYEGAQTVTYAFEARKGETYQAAFTGQNTAPRLERTQGGGITPRISPLASDGATAPPQGPQRIPQPPSRPGALDATRTPGSDLSGAWISDDPSWGTLEFLDDGRRVVASYPKDNGHLHGTRSGDTVEGFWFEDKAKECCPVLREGHECWGRFRLTFTKDRFSGVWGYCDQPLKYRWTGRRK